MKEKVRPIYSELQGYLSQAPPSQTNNSIFDKEVWERYNLTISELSRVSGYNFSGYEIKPRLGVGFEDGMVSVLDYRTKLGGLIARLHGQFFSNELAPFSGMPTTIIHQNQQQNVSFQIQMLFEIRDKIDKKIQEFQEGSKERTFLEKVKDALTSANTISQLISLLLKTGKDVGLTIDEILNIFI